MLRSKRSRSTPLQPGSRLPATMPRRTFLVLAANSLGGLTILAALPLLSSGTLRAQAPVAVDDPRIRTETVALDADWGRLDCYLARPIADEANPPCVIVAHDKLGLTPYFESVARRLAAEGFVTLAPDYASRFGGTPAEPGPALEVVGMATWASMVADTQTALHWLTSNGQSSAKVGAIGFGMGATAISHAITKLPGLKAAVIFYGHPPPPSEVASIKTPLLLNFAGKDQFIDPEIPGSIDALKKAGVTYEVYVYENTVRGFDDDGDTAHYEAGAANLAWSRTIAFLKANLV
jgi:carboxymethylenebutenolidase